MKYHAAIYLPNIPAAVLRLRYSRHAQDAAKDDRYGDLSRYLPQMVRTDRVQVVEADTFVNAQDREVFEKLLVRFSVGNGIDLCLVVLAQPGNVWLVKTVWANLSTDTHSTLRNREAYAKGPRTNR